MRRHLCRHKLREIKLLHPRLENSIGFRDLARFGVREGNHGAIQDRRVREDMGFEFRGCDLIRGHDVLMVCSRRLEVETRYLKSAEFDKFLEPVEARKSITKVLKSKRQNIDRTYP